MDENIICFHEWIVSWFLFTYLPLNGNCYTLLTYLLCFNLFCKLHRCDYNNNKDDEDDNNNKDDDDDNNSNNDDSNKQLEQQQQQWQRWNILGKKFVSRLRLSKAVFEKIKFSFFSQTILPLVCGAWSLHLNEISRFGASLCL